MLLQLPSLASIIDYNEAITGERPDRERQQRAQSCLSTFSYYETIEEQIACITGLLVKNHYFVDGNKRTASFAFLYMCEINGITCDKSDDELARCILQIASATYNVSNIVRILF